MKIYNQKSKSTLEAIVCYLLAFIVFIAIDLGILFVYMNTGLSFFDSVSTMYSGFLETDLKMKLLVILLLVSPFLWGWLFVIAVINRKNDLDFLKSLPETIEYLNFSLNGIDIYCQDASYNRHLSYDEVERLSLIIETGLVHGKYGYYSAITGLEVEIKGSDKNVYKIYHAPVKLNNIYKLVYYSQFIDKFKYKFTGNGNDIKEKLTKSINKFIENKYKNTVSQNLTNAVMWFLYGIIACCAGVIIFMLVPPFASSADKEYVSIIEEGYRYYQNGQYDEALDNYERALQRHDDDSVLYDYMATNYYRLKYYREAVKYAQKGIDCLKNKSTYYKVKNYKFMSREIGLYSTLGDAYFKLEEYQKAKEAYTFVADNVKYIYTDAYFNRGMCEYYLGEKRQALQDFYHHKVIIESYFREQENSEYKDKYPRYNTENLENIKLWIEECKKL